MSKGGREPAPDETTACRFRHLIETHDLARRIFEAVHRHLEACGIKVATGTIVDATIIAAPSSTKNAAKARDPDMHQTKKGNQRYFGMKALRHDRDEDARAVAAGIAFLGAGRELIRIRDDGRTTPAKRAVQTEVLRFVAHGDSQKLSSAQRAVEEASRICLPDLRNDGLTIGEARAAGRELAAFAAIRDELERSGELVLNERTVGETADVG